MALSNRLDRVSEMIEELIEKEERYEIFLNASPFGIMVVDQTFHIVFVNKATEKLSGYSASELLGEHMHILMPESDRKGHVKHEIEYLKRPFILDRIGNHGARPRLLHKNGEEIPVELSLAPVNLDGKKLFYASIRLLETLYNTVERPSEL